MTTVKTSTFGTTAKGEEVCFDCQESLIIISLGDQGHADQWQCGGGPHLLGGDHHRGQVSHRMIIRGGQ